MQAVSSAAVRRAPRVSATVPISLLLEREDSKTGHDAYTVDLSRLGARVRTVIALAPGEKVGILPSGDSGKAIRTHVVWVQRSSAAGSLAGLEYLEPAEA